MADAQSKREKLLEQRRKLDAQIRAIDAKERAQKRKDETRQKIIVGSLIMAESDRDPLLKQRVRSLIDQGASEKDRDFLADWLNQEAGSDNAADDVT